MIENELQVLGRNVVRLRKDQGWTRKDFCNKISITKDRLRRIEKGEINIRFGTIVRIAVALKVEISALFENK